MREIKFRAYNKIDHLLCDVVEIVFGDDDNYVAVENGEYIQRWRFDDIEILQYTGLKDMNGRDIYEGDVVLRINEDLTVEDEPMLVKYRSEGARFTTNMISIYQPDGERKYKVIGNKYQNPELLEVTK